MAKRRITRTQRIYIALIHQRGELDYGWGGYRSTLTVRILEERGLAQLRYDRGGVRWRAQLTKTGVDLAKRLAAILEPGDG